MLLESLRVKVYQIQRELIDHNEHITAAKIKYLFAGNGNNKRTLVTTFEEHNRKARELAGIDFAPANCQRYETTLKHLQHFMQLYYKKDDFYLVDLAYSFITDFEHYLAEEYYIGLEPDSLTDSMEIVNYVNQYSDYLELVLDENSEYVYKTKYDIGACYLMNINRMYIIEGAVYKVFTSGLLATSVDNIDIVRYITEENISTYKERTGYYFIDYQNTNQGEKGTKDPTYNLGTYISGKETNNRERIWAFSEWYQTSEASFNLGSRVSYIWRYHARPYRKTCGIWFWARRTVSYDLNMAYDYKINKTDWYRNNTDIDNIADSDLTYLVKRVGYRESIGNNSLHFAGFNCWTKIPATNKINWITNSHLTI